MWKAERMNEVLSTFTALQTSRCLSSTALTAAGSLTPGPQCGVTVTQPLTTLTQCPPWKHRQQNAGGLQEELQPSPDLGAHTQAAPTGVLRTWAGAEPALAGWEGRGGMGLELLLVPSTDRLLSFESLLEQNSFVLMILSRSYSSVLSSPLNREGAVLKMLFGSHLFLFLMVKCCQLEQSHLLP